MSTLGGIIRKARVTNGYSQRELAAKVGVSGAFINRLEMSVRNATDDVLHRIAAALDADPDLLVRQAAIERVRRAEAKVAAMRKELR